MSIDGGTSSHFFRDRVGQGLLSPFPPLEPYVKVSLHTARALTKGTLVEYPGCFNLKPALPAWPHTPGATLPEAGGPPYRVGAAKNTWRIREDKVSIRPKASDDTT